MVESSYNGYEHILVQTEELPNKGKSGVMCTLFKNNDRLRRNYAAEYSKILAREL